VHGRSALARRSPFSSGDPSSGIWAFAITRDGLAAQPLADEVMAIAERADDPALLVSAARP
jgi:hypothetical protein